MASRVPLGSGLRTLGVLRVSHFIEGPQPSTLTQMWRNFVSRVGSFGAGILLHPVPCPCYKSSDISLCRFYTLIRCFLLMLDVVSFDLSAPAAGFETAAAAAGPLSALPASRSMPPSSPSVSVSCPRRRLFVRAARRRRSPSCVCACAHVCGWVCRAHRSYGICVGA